jgi:hypothetical protein
MPVQPWFGDQHANLFLCHLAPFVSVLRQVSRWTNYTWFSQVCTNLTAKAAILNMVCTLTESKVSFQKLL